MQIKWGLLPEADSCLAIPNHVSRRDVQISDLLCKRFAGFLRLQKHVTTSKKANISASTQSSSTYSFRSGHRVTQVLLNVLHEDGKLFQHLQRRAQCNMERSINVAGCAVSPVQL